MNIETLKRRKKELKMTFEELSALSDVSISALKDIFRGDTPHPRIDTIQAIERALGISEQSYEEQAKMTVSPSEAEILALWRELSDDGQATTKAMMILLAQQKK